MRIFFASKKELLIEALSQLLIGDDDYVISGAIRSLTEFSDQPELQRSDVIILTEPGFECSTLCALQKIQMLSNKKPVVIVSCFRELNSATIFFKHSVRAILTKDCCIEELYKALKNASLGKPFITPVLAQALVADLCKCSNREIKLSPREAEIVGFIVRGSSTSEIAKTLRLSAKTVSAHKSSIKSRLNLRGTSEIIQYAIEHGFQ